MRTLDASLLTDCVIVVSVSHNVVRVQVGHTVFALVRGRYMTRVVVAMRHAGPEEVTASNPSGTRVHSSSSYSNAIMITVIEVQVRLANVAGFNVGWVPLDAVLGKVVSVDGRRCISLLHMSKDWKLFFIYLQPHNG